MSKELLDSFLDTLHAEYIQAEIRLKIYPSEKDKKFWQRVLDAKESKIKSVATRLDVHSIFTDESIKLKLIEEIAPHGQLPKFTYRNDIEKEELEIKDRNYFSNYLGKSLF